MHIHRRTLLGVAACLVTAACGGGTATDSTTTTSTSATTTTTTTAPTTTTTTVPEPTLFVSDDGDLEVEVPGGIGVAVTIDLVDPADYPPELAGAAQNPNSRIYDLGPSGTTFEEPVRVTRTIPIENFGELGPNEVPVVYLMTRSDDGTYELLDDLHVMRIDDVVEVSGDASHFSGLVSIYGRINADLLFDDQHSSFATMEDSDFFLGVVFRDSEGNPLNRPEALFPWARARNEVMVADDSGDRPGIRCTGIGEGRPRLGYRVTLTAQFEEGQAGLVGPNALNPEVEEAEVLLKMATAFRCLDPAETIFQPLVHVGVFVDHPGGEERIPGEDYRGGFSGLTGHLMDSGHLQGAYAGLIGDANGNGLIDSNDALFAMYPTMTGPSGQEFVLPLFGFGTYFIYVLDAAAFPPLEPWTSPPAMRLDDGIAYLEGLFTGPGTLADAFGVVVVDGMPRPIDVGSSEGGEEFDGAIVRFPVDS